MSAFQASPVRAPDLTSQVREMAYKVNLKLRETPEILWVPVWAFGKAMEGVSALANTGYKAPNLNDWRDHADIPTLIINIGAGIILVGILVCLL